MLHYLLPKGRTDFPADNVVTEYAFFQKSGAAGRLAVSDSICHRLAAPPHRIFPIFAFWLFE